MTNKERPIPLGAAWPQSWTRDALPSSVAQPPHVVHALVLGVLRGY